MKLGMYTEVHEYFLFSIYFKNCWWIYVNLLWMSYFSKKYVEKGAKLLLNLLGLYLNVKNYHLTGDVWYARNFL